MQPAVLIRLRPLGPWRFGTGEGGNHRLDTLFRSDRLYSAVTLAMAQLGSLDEWLDATARAESPALTFSSLFPFQGDTLFVPPPATLWPPPPSLLTSPSPGFLAKMRWEAIRFIPVSLAEALVIGQPVLADQWVIDGESGCLLRRDRPSQSPFRFASRPRAAVDRLTSASQGADHAACLEFEAGSGLWFTLRFATPQAEQIWSDRIRASFRLLADTGFGGRRSAGWGQTAEPEWKSGTWPAILFPKVPRQSSAPETPPEGLSPFYWLLSLYSPASSDVVNWKLGDYSLTVRGGRVQSSAGAGSLKKTVRMMAEGSVFSSQEAPVGMAVDVAPDGFAHPVYRSGFALALRLPVVGEIGAGQLSEEPVESTPTESSLEASREEASELLSPAVHSDLVDEEKSAHEEESVHDEKLVDDEKPVDEPRASDEEQSVHVEEPVPGNNSVKQAQPAATVEPIEAPQNNEHSQDNERSNDEV